VGSSESSARQSRESGGGATDQLIERANATGRVQFTRTVLDGRSVLRISVGASATTRDDALAAWELLAAHA